MTAATYLAREGLDVLLIEKNDVVGGLVNTFLRDGFYFDAGVRALEDAGIILPMLKDLGIELDVVKSPVSIGIEDMILRIEDISSLSQYKGLLKKLYPESGSEIDAVLKIIRRIMKHMNVLYGIENPVFKDLKKDYAFIFRTLLPWMPKFLWTIWKINRMQTPVEDFLATVVKNVSLRDMISQHFFKATPTFFAMSYFSLYLDYFYPKGGVGKLSEAVFARYREFGGKIITNSMVKSVSPARKTVIDDKGIDHGYKNLIWAADLKTLYRIADVQDMPAEVKARFMDAKTRMLDNKGGESVFSLFLQVNEPLDSFGSIATGHFFYTPSRQGLGQIHRGELRDLLNRFQEIGKEEILAWLDRFISLNTFEISIPGLKDSDLSSPGKTGLIISFLADYELFEKVREAGWLEEFVSGIEKRVIKVISNSVYPMLKDKIISCLSFSPLSVHDRIASSEGAIVGWMFQEDMPVVNRIQIADRSVLTPLPSVFQAGQWAYSPAGVPMSILTGKLAANRVVKASKSRNSSS